MREIVFQGHDNTISLLLQNDDENGVLVNSDLTSVTRIVLEFATWDEVVDSAVTPGAIDWSAGGGIVNLKLGSSGIPDGTHQVTLVVYEAAYPNGIRWTPAFCVVAQPF